jgi:hypothetical protein
MYFINGDISFGYTWRQQGYTYYVSAHCCLDAHVTAVDLRRLIRSLRPLGVEWIGRTAQGDPISLYLSSAGLDYYVEWHAQCDDGDVINEFTQADPLLPLSADGSFVDQGPYRVTDDPETPTQVENINSSLAGRLTGNTAQGNWQAHVEGQLVDQGTTYSCDTGPVSWTAQRLL